MTPFSSSLSSSSFLATLRAVRVILGVWFAAPINDWSKSSMNDVADAAEEEDKDMIEVEARGFATSAMITLFYTCDHDLYRTKKTDSTSHSTRQRDNEEASLLEELASPNASL